MVHFRKTFKRNLNLKRFYTKEKYDRSIKSLDYWFYDKLSSKEPWSKEELVQLDLVIDIISNDLEWTYRSKYFYDLPNNGERPNSCHPFPTSYKNKDGKLVSAIIKNTDRIIDSDKHYILAVPAVRKSFRYHSLRTDEYDPNKNKPMGIYYEGSKIAYFYEGKHSLSIAKTKKENFKCLVNECCNFDSVLDNVYTDGFAFYNSYDNSYLENVFVYQAAVLYTLLKRRREIKM